MVGTAVGRLVEGANVGLLLGEGAKEGCPLVSLLGLDVGILEGSDVGDDVVCEVGDKDGCDVGFEDGMDIG